MQEPRLSLAVKIEYDKDPSNDNESNGVAENKCLSENLSRNSLASGFDGNRGLTPSRPIGIGIGTKCFGLHMLISPGSVVDSIGWVELKSPSFRARSEEVD
ncbi:MAG: hypothetical protein AAF664_20010 [Planctomycetota bacterium]